MKVHEYSALYICMYKVQGLNVTVSLIDDFRNHHTEHRKCRHHQHLHQAEETQ